MIYLLTHPTEQPGERARAYIPGPVSACHFWRLLMQTMRQYPYLRLSEIWFGEAGT